MQEMIKSGFKFFIGAGFFGICINLIYLAVPVYMMIVYDRVLFSSSQASLYTLGAGVLISLLMMGGIDFFRQRILDLAGNQLAQKMQPFVIKNLPSYPGGLHDLELLRNALTGGHVLHALDLPWMLVYLIILYFIHPFIGGISFAAVLIAGISLVLLRVLEKKRYILADLAFKSNIDSLQRSLGHSELVSGMGMYGAVIKKYRETDDKVMALRADAGAFQSGIQAALRFFYVAVSVLVFGTGVVVFFSGEITVGAVFASVLMMVRLLYPLERSLSDMKISIEAMAAYARLKEFVNMEKQKDMLSLPAPEGKFNMEAISLALNGKTILHNIAFSLNPGESLGIFGPSSAGKTSLCKVMLGIWPAAAGKVRLDGAEISQWPRDEFGGYVGYLPQETELFPANVAENISRLQEVDSEKVVKAAQKAGVHEMMLKLPQGYDTQIDLTGKNLSAAQRQLISLARALYGDPKFVVMDEPHTHLDDLGFKILLQALDRLKIEKTTTVIVTDRPNLLVNMDKILVIKDGQVAMYGPAKDVLNQLVNRQQPQAAGV